MNLVCRMAKERNVPVFMCGVKTDALPAMETYLRDGVHAFCMEATILNDLKAQFMELDLHEPQAELPPDPVTPLPETALLCTMSE